MIVIFYENIYVVEKKENQIKTGYRYTHTNTHQNYSQNLQEMQGILHTFEIDNGSQPCYHLSQRRKGK